MKPKRIISLLVAVCMVVAMLPVSAFAADTQVYTSGDYQYTLNDDGTATITKYTATEQTLAANNYQVEIPSELDGHRVTAIGPSSFLGKSNNVATNCSAIQYVAIPDSVVSIGDYSFAYTGLKEISIPDSVKMIDYMAFCGCSDLGVVNFEEPSKIEVLPYELFVNCTSLTTINIPTSVKEIKLQCFVNCSSLTNLVIPEGVELIGRQAFSKCSSLQNITIPSTIVESGIANGGTAPQKGIEKGAFWNCNSLINVYYNGTEEQWNKIVNYDPDTTATLAGQTRDNSILKKEGLVKCAHTVTFNNGAVADVQKVIVPYNETVTAPKAPVINGYKLAGYYTDDTYTDQFDFSQKITTDTPVYVKWEKIPATLTTSTEKLTCTVGEPATVEFAIATNGDAGNPAKVSLTVSNQDAVDSLKVNGQTMQNKDFTYSLSHLIGMTGKVEAVFNKAGTYTMTATLAVEGNEPVVRTVEVTVKEKPVEPVVTYALAVKDGKVKVDGNSVTADEKGVYEVAENAKVEVTFDQSTLSDAQVFDQWTITPASVLNAVDPKSEAISFTMPAEKVTIEAMTRDATIESDGPGVLGTAAMIGVGVAGTAVLGYQSYMIGTELYLNTVLPKWAVIPQNRGELALLLWKDADQPEPAGNVLYADIDENDTDTQQAARWAVENNLMKLPDAENNPDHFEPAAPVTRWEVIQTWNQEQEMKKA